MRQNGGRRPPRGPGSWPRCPDPCEQALDFVIGPWRDLKGHLPPGYQANHLNQNAAYGEPIPMRYGVAIGLFGNVRLPSHFDSPHTLFHKSIERFWDQFRIGGSHPGKLPTNGEYGKAIAEALQAAGCHADLASAFAEYARAAREAWGLREDGLVKVIPRKMYFPEAP